MIDHNRIICCGKDTGPNKGPCENLATTKNSMGQSVCESCYQLSEYVLKRLHEVIMEVDPMYKTILPLPHSRMN